MKCFAITKLTLYFIYWRSIEIILKLDLINFQSQTIILNHAYTFIPIVLFVIQGPLWKPAETCHLRSHLQAGIGHYHHLLLRLQSDYKFDLRGIIDFPFIVGDNGLKKGIFRHDKCLVF